MESIEYERVCGINPNTGEVQEYPVGSLVVTPEQQERERKIREQRARYFEEKQRKDLIKSYNRNFRGGFFLVNQGERFADLPPEAVAKLIFLAAHLHYDGRIMFNRQRQMVLNDLPTVLGVSKSTVQRFLALVSPQYIAVGDDGGLSIATSSIYRGTLGRKQFTRWQTVFSQSVKALYKVTKIIDHKWLGIIFTVLPFINVEFNLLCRPESVEETNLNNITMLTLGEFCEIIGFDRSHIGNLIAAVQRLRFTVDGREELLCCLITDGSYGHANDCLFVNPKVIYAGSHPKEIAGLAKSCEALASSPITTEGLQTVNRAIS